ncbi:MAG TPA: peptidase S15, partial [Candidatus Competibacteraceae bacterium]|nr:peptidase S15 [Candidatus Competibacteraceae bacterium]
ASRLRLPVRPPRPEDAALPAFAAPEHGPHAPVTPLAEGRFQRESRFDFTSGTATYITHGEGGLFGEGVLRFDAIDLTLDHGLRRELSIQEHDPLSARYVITQHYAMGREGWRIRIETRTAMSATADTFHLEGELRAYANGELAAERRWQERIARDLV